jgi:hypothetical protein
MTVQANAAPLGLAWQNTACGSCTRRRTTLPEPKERSKLFCRKSCAEAKELCPADHSLATCTVTTTARKGRWLAISRLPRRPARPRPRRPRRPRPSRSCPQAVPMDVPAVPDIPQTSPPSHAVPQAVAQGRPRHSTPSAGRPPDVPAVLGLSPVVLRTSPPSQAIPRAVPQTSRHPRPSPGVARTRPLRPSSAPSAIGASLPR